MRKLIHDKLYGQKKRVRLNMLDPGRQRLEYILLHPAQQEWLHKLALSSVSKSILVATVLSILFYALLRIVNTCSRYLWLKPI